MKRTVVVYVVILLLATVCLAAMPVSGEAAIYDDVIRLHVLAASDTEEDQRRKLLVRDAVLAEFGNELASCREKAEAEALLTRLLPELKTVAEETLRAEGDTSPVTVTLSREEYDRRVYDDFTMPAGEYLSLRIVIGEGAGQNWWCVLFPPLCTELAVENDPAATDIPVGLTPDEYELITGATGEYRVRFKVLEMLAEVLQ